MIRFDNTLQRLENLLTWVPLALAALIGSAQILSRYVFGIHLLGAEEAIVYLIILSTYLGSAVLVRDNGHIAMQIISPFVKRRGQWVMSLVGTIVALMFFVFMFYLSVLLVSSPSALNTTTRVLKVPLWVVDLALLLGFLLMAYHATQNLITLVRTRSPLTTFSGDTLEGFDGEEKGGQSGS